MGIFVPQSDIILVPEKARTILRTRDESGRAKTHGLSPFIPEAISEGSSLEGG